MAKPDVKYYYAPGSCSLAPHIILHEIGVDFESIPMRPGEARDPYPESFRQINPKMRVPAIAIDGEIITELPAVMTIIASLAPERNLMGGTPLENARVYEWLNWLSGTLHTRGFSHFHRPDRFSDEAIGLDGIRSSGRKTIVECFGEIENRLGGVYAVGDHLTAVDPFLFVCYRWGKKQGHDEMSKYKRYSALVENLLQRESVIRTLEKENISF